MSATAQTITGAVATGTTTGLALDETALIALVTPGAVTKAAGSSAGSVDLSFSAASTAFDYLAKGEVLTLTYTVAIDDGDGGITSQTFTITVTGTNDAPVLIASAPSLTTITEDETANAGQTVASFLGAGIADVDHGALQGIAITATTSAHGHWEYSTDGSTFIAFPAVSERFRLAAGRDRHGQVRPRRRRWRNGHVHVCGVGSNDGRPWRRGRRLGIGRFHRLLRDVGYRNADGDGGQRRADRGRACDALRCD